MGSWSGDRALRALHPQPRGRWRWGESSPTWGATQRCPVQEGLEVEKAEAAAGHGEVLPTGRSVLIFGIAALEIFKVLSKVI